MTADPQHIRIKGNTDIKIAQGAIHRSLAQGELTSYDKQTGMELCSDELRRVELMESIRTSVNTQASFSMEQSARTLKDFDEISGEPHVPVHANNAPPSRSGLHPLQKSLIKSLQENHASPHSSDSPQAEGKQYELGKIMGQGCITGVSIASTFGLASVLNNIARNHPNPAVKVGGTMLLPAAAITSAYVGEGLHKLFDIRASAADKASLMRDAATPAAFITTNYAYMLSNLPKFSPRSPAGLFTTLAVSGIGSAIGAGTAEAIAQGIPESAPPLIADGYEAPTTLQCGIGRATTQLPAVYLHQVMAAAAAAGPVPRSLSMALPAVIGVPFTIRHYVTPLSEKDTRQPHPTPKIDLQ